MRSLHRLLREWQHTGRRSSFVKLAERAYALRRDLPDLILFPTLLRSLRRTPCGRDPDEVVDMAMTGFQGRFRPIQIRAELIGLARRVARLEPCCALEIGTARGGSLFVLTQLASPSASVVSVDLPGGWFGGGYSIWRRPLYAAFARANQSLVLLRADSHASETVEAVRLHLDDKPLDYLMIDGDHTYHGVERDYELYAPMVRPGGMIVFHDIVPHPQDPQMEVWRFWQDVRRNSEFVEIVADWQQSGCGIGIITAHSVKPTVVTP